MASSSSSSASPLRDSLPWVLVAPSMFLLGYGGNHFTPLLPLFQDLMDLAPWQTNMLLSCYVAGLVPGLLIAATISDRIGRKPVVLGGLVSTILGNGLIPVGAALIDGGSLAVVYIGRFLAGIGVGVAMSVCSTWIKELSSPPFEDASFLSGARRPATTQTVGLGLGALVTGSLAQWAPGPAVTSFVVFIVFCLIALIPTVRAPESTTRMQRLRHLAHQRIEARRPASATGGRPGYTRDLLLGVFPAGIWVFGSAGVAYAIVPQVMAEELGDTVTIYATALSVLTLLIGAGIQRYAGAIGALMHLQPLTAGVVVSVVGILVAWVATFLVSPVLGVLAAIILGVAYGVIVVSGLARVQYLVPRTRLATWTGLFYAVAYIGFLFPTILSALLPVVPYTVSLLFTTGFALICALVVGISNRGRTGGQPGT